ncbi:MAG: hypothetical protein FJY42_10215 [Betaproteobacteria bacterium]|nr:hypothetical protein [Betaproteobacteria bacterium]
MIHCRALGQKRQAPRSGCHWPAGQPRSTGVPAVADTVPGFEVVSWFGILAPAKFPMDLARRINREVQKVLGNTVFRDKV